MDIDKNMTLEEFILLSPKKISQKVKLAGIKAGCIVTDGNQRLAITQQTLDKKTGAFDKNYVRSQAKHLVSVASTFFKYGLDAVVLPVAIHENFERKYFDMFKTGILYLFDNKMINYYGQKNIKVIVYGDLDFAETNGLTDLKSRTADVMQCTKNNTYVLYVGVCCSRAREELRLAKLAVEFYTRNKRKPTEEDMIKLYFGDAHALAKDISFIIRPLAIKTSGTDPLFSRGPRLFSPQCPLNLYSPREFEACVLKPVLYELLLDTQPQGKKEYSQVPNSTFKEKLKKWERSKSKVIGID